MLCVTYCFKIWMRFSHTHMLIFTISNSLTSVTKILTNLLVLITIFKLTANRKPSYLVSTALSCTDFTVGLVTNSSLQYMLFNFINQLTCQSTMILLSCYYVLLVLSIFLTMLATTERLIRISFSDQYSHHFTRSRTAISILVISVTRTLDGLVLAANTTFEKFVTTQ